MSDAAFAELESQVEELPLFQIVVLRQKLGRVLERKKTTTNVAAGLALLDEFSGSVEREIDLKTGASRKCVGSPALQTSNNC